MAANPHKPRGRNEVFLLPTVDGHALLARMIETVGLRETARRLARTPTAVRHWHSGRIRVPEVVRQWLLTAATNSRKAGSIDGLRWHYPRPRPAVRERHRDQKAVIRAMHRAENRRMWEETLAAADDFDD
jgi:hypothetical protein